MMRVVRGNAAVVAILTVGGGQRPPAVACRSHEGIDPPAASPPATGRPKYTTATFLGEIGVVNLVKDISRTWLYVNMYSKNL